MQRNKISIVYGERNKSCFPFMVQTLIKIKCIWQHTNSVHVQDDITVPLTYMQVYAP